MSAQKPVDLLPCPFCGGGGRFDNASDDGGAHCVRCDNCDLDLMGGPVGIGWWPTESDAASAWNGRCLDASVERLIEVLGTGTVSGGRIYFDERKLRAALAAVQGGP